MQLVLRTVLSACVLVMCAPRLSAQDIAKGVQVFADQRCAACHSIRRKGNTKGPLDAVGTTLNDDEIRRWIVDPVSMTAQNNAERKPPMPAKYAWLSNGDLDALVAYLSSLKKKSSDR